VVGGDVARCGLEWHSPLDVGEAAGLAAVDALSGLLVAAEAEFGVHYVVSVVMLMRGRVL